MRFHARKNVAHRAWFHHFVYACLFNLCALIGSNPTYAQSTPKARNAQGSLLVGLGLGASLGGDAPVSIGVGGHLGYAIFDGIVPGVRVLTLWSEAVAMELAATITLSPPWKTYVVPYLDAEVGGRFDPIGKGFMYGAGAGFYLGRVTANYSLKIGYMYRKISYTDDLVFDASRPHFSVSLHF